MTVYNFYLHFLGFKELINYKTPFHSTMTTHSRICITSEIMIEINEFIAKADLIINNENNENDDSTEDGKK